jgi:hypothetical protein
VRDALGVSCPSNSMEERPFVQKFHGIYGARVAEGFARAPHPAEPELAQPA